MADCKTSNYPALCPAACKERLFARASLQTRLYLSILFHVCAHFSKLPNRPNASESFPLFLHFHRYKHTPSPPAVKQLLLGHKNFFLFFFHQHRATACCRRRRRRCCTRQRLTGFYSNTFGSAVASHRLTAITESQSSHCFPDFLLRTGKKKEENLAKIPVKQTDSGFAEGKTRCGNTRVTLIRN